jgi:hypothetical protein
MNGLKLSVMVATLVFAAAFIACGSSASVPSTSTATPTVFQQLTPTSVSTHSPTPTPEPTSAPLSADAPEVTQVLALSGFPEFARQFANAVAANDTQFFIDRGYVNSETCNGGGMGGIPCPAGQMKVPVDVISVGAWNSEGDYYTKDLYDDLVTNYLSSTRAPNATIYAVGHEKRFGGETEAGADIVVSGVGLPVPSSQPVDPNWSLNFRVQPIDGVWRITHLDRAYTLEVPYFFDWYALWSDVFPPG